MTSRVWVHEAKEAKMRIKISGHPHEGMPVLLDNPGCSFVAIGTIVVGYDAYSRFS